MKDAISRDTFVMQVEKEDSEVDAAHGCSDWLLAKGHG
jgi:hypothetical protein